MKLLATIFIIATIATVSCGEGPIMIETGIHEAIEVKALDSNTEDRVVSLLNKFNALTIASKRIPVAVNIGYDPTRGCSANVVAYNQKQVINISELSITLNVINFCHNPADMNDASLEQTLFHELGHCHFNLKHIEEQGIMNANKLDVDYYEANRIELIADMFNLSVKTVELIMN
jgi:hypothetical protein